MSNNQIINVIDPTNAQDAATKNYVDSNTWSLAGNAIASTNKLGSTNDVDISIVRNNVNKISCTNTSVQVLSSLYIRKVTDDLPIEDPADATLYFGCTTLAAGDTFLISIGKPSNKIYWANATNAQVIIDAQYGMRLRVNGGDLLVLYPTYMICSKELSMYSNKISSVADPTNAQDVATKNYVDTHLASGLGNVTSPINMNGNEITGLPTSITCLTSDSSSISKKVFIDVMSDALALKLNKSGGADEW